MNGIILKINGILLGKSNKTDRTDMTVPTKIRHDLSIGEKTGQGPRKSIILCPIFMKGIILRINSILFGRSNKTDSTANFSSQSE